MQHSYPSISLPVIQSFSHSILMHIHTHFAVLRAVYDSAPGQDAELGDIHLVVQVTDERHGADALG